MKKLFVLFVSIVALCSAIFFGCSESNENQGNDTSQTDNSQTNASQDDKYSTMRTLYDGELCKVEFLKIYDYADLNYGTQDLGYVYLQLRIENKTDSKVMAYLKDCSINGFTVTALSGMTPNIGAGEKLQTAYFFNYSATDISNKSQIETIKFKVNLQNEYFSSVFLSDEFVLTF